TAGGAASSANVQVDFDIRIDGATSATPVQMEIKQAGGYTSTFSPTGLVNGQYQHVTYLLNQGAESGVFSDSSNFSQLRFNMGNNFGADSDNVFHLDNFVLSVVPEPTSLATLSLLGLGALRRARRR